MPKRKKEKINAVVEGGASSKPAGGKRKGRRTGFIVTAAIIALILVIAGVLYYQFRFAPFQQPVLTIDKTVIRMDYFLKRARMAGSDPNVLQRLVDERIITLMAPSFGITVTGTEVDDALLYRASTENATGNLTGRYLTENEFNVWYRQQLNASGLPDPEYKEMTRINMLAAKLQQYLAQRIPTVGEQIHLNVILVANSADAAKVKARIQAGENFTAVASEVSLDTQSKDKGGDIGWLPRGVLPFDSTIFALGVGTVSDAVAVNPTAPNTSQYLLFMVSDKAAGRVIDDNSLQVLKSRALGNWLLQEAPSHSIVVNYDFNNSANQAWINWQLAKVGR